MQSSANDLFLKSHVSRDFLQNAALFRSDRLVIWEYVSNGLQYAASGVSSVVKVLLDNHGKKIVITDNGRGMDWPGLQNFFVMHGENIDRKEGNPGRGRFGTGKSAAFGIGDLLRVTTVRNGKRARVELRRTDVESMTSGGLIPIKVLERAGCVTDPNGTIVEIEGIHLKSLDQAGVIRYIERHLARWPRNATVFVNNHECEFNEPLVSRELRFKPEGLLKENLGEVELKVKVSKGPLEEDFRGVSIYSNGVWHETTLAGSEGREMSQYIFGEIDIPRLDENRSPISPFDLSRSMRLNPNNELVQAVYAFVGQKIEEVRRELAASEEERRAGEEAKKLKAQADEIARVINEDFEAFRQKITKAKAKAAGGVDLQSTQIPGDSEKSGLTTGDEVPAEVVPPSSGDGRRRKSDIPKPPAIVAKPEAEKRGRQADGSYGQSRGGFQVRFDRLGEEAFRASYIRGERTIYINLDHPQLTAAKALGTEDDPSFRRLAYEVAFSEYAIALASELVEEYIDPSDPIVEIRETINRLAKKGAVLYAP